MSAPSVRPSGVAAIAATTVPVAPLAVLKAMRAAPRPLKESVPTALLAVEISVQVLPAVGGAQNAQAEIRIGGIVGFARARQNHALSRIGVSGLNHNRADGKRCLIISDCSPSHIVGWAGCRIGGLPHATLRAPDVDGIAAGVGGIDGYGGGTS